MIATCTCFAVDSVRKDNHIYIGWPGLRDSQTAVREECLASGSGKTLRRLPRRSRARPFRFHTGRIGNRLSDVTQGASPTGETPTTSVFYAPPVSSYIALFFDPRRILKSSGNASISPFGREGGSPHSVVSPGITCLG